MSKKSGYSWVKRASRKERIEMLEIVRETRRGLYTHGWDPTEDSFLSARKVRTSDSWVLEIYDLRDGKRWDCASFVRCNKCGAIRELFDGQIEFCSTCDDDWEV